jgi:hypothetical protein
MGSEFGSTKRIIHHQFIQYGLFVVTFIASRGRVGGFAGRSPETSVASAISMQEKGSGLASSDCGYFAGSFDVSILLAGLTFGRPEAWVRAKVVRGGYQ